MRQHPRSWAGKNIAWRIYLNLPNSPTRESHPPQWRQNPTALRIHRIFRTMPEELREAMLVLYVNHEWDWRQRAESLGVKRAKLYQLRDNLHYYLAGRLDIDSPQVAP